MNLDLLATLKQKLVEAKEFSTVMTYFFDHFGEDAKFMRLGKPIRHEQLEKTLGVVGGSLFGKPVVLLERMMLTHLEKQQFIHGGFTMNGHLGTVLYFDDIQVGLLCIALSLDDTRLIRFSARLVNPSPEPSLN